MRDDIFNDDTLLARWLSGELSPAEKEALEAHPDFPAFQRIVAAADRLSLPDPEVQAMWARFAPLMNNVEKPPVNRRRFLWWAAVAASLAGLLIFGWPLLTKQLNTTHLVETGIGEQKTVTLPDGSTVRLNAVSTLRFDEKGWEKKRLLQLDGEAFFDVKKNPGAPFILEVHEGYVTVLGTTFSVKSRDFQFEVSCYTGFVSAISKDTYEVVLKGGQKSAALNGEGDWVSVTTVSGEKPVWTSGESRFEDASLGEVLDELQRQYQIQVVAKDVRDLKYAGAFPHNNLDLALKLICEPLGLKYQQTGNEVQIKK